MSEIVDQSFMEAIEKASSESGTGEYTISEKTKAYILERVRPLMDQSFDQLQELMKDENNTVIFVRQAVCALLTRELMKRQITEAEFWTFMKYENLFSTSTGFYINSNRGPSLVLRFGQTITPPIEVWRDGTWGWTSILFHDLSEFDLEILGAGIAKKDPTAYVMRIDAMNRKVPVSAVTAKKSKCFIATACYGDPDATEVTCLREFRDSTLNATSIGRAFVFSYYALSPPIAAFLQRHHGMANCVKLWVLNPLVRRIGLRKHSSRKQ